MAPDEIEWHHRAFLDILAEHARCDLDPLYADGHQAIRALIEEIHDQGYNDTSRGPANPAGTAPRLGLCGDRQDHEPHAVMSGSLARFWCHADQSRRLPYAAEQRRKTSQ